jgi:hypothetical protein
MEKTFKVSDDCWTGFVPEEGVQVGGNSSLVLLHGIANGLNKNGFEVFIQIFLLTSTKKVLLKKTLKCAVKVSIQFRLLTSTKKDLLKKTFEVLFLQSLFSLFLLNNN